MTLDGFMALARACFQVRYVQQVDETALSVPDENAM
jgi:hypothetical protein